MTTGQVTEAEAILRGLPALGGLGTLSRWWSIATLGTPTRIIQEATEVFGVGSSVKGRRFSRVLHTTWSPWRETFTQASVLGPVSQSAGIPTGAVIERGSNANGPFVRFADGTQICRHVVAAASGAAATWTFPAAFSEAPVVVGVAQASVLSCVVLDAAPTATACTFSARDNANARRADSVRLSATGVWF